MSIGDPQLAATLLKMERNRAELRATFLPPPQDGRFPRSATFRWVAKRVSGGSIAAAVLGAAVAPSPWVRLLGGLFLRRAAARWKSGKGRTRTRRA
jgi:hypothetical protein